MTTWIRAEHNNRMMMVILLGLILALVSGCSSLKSIFGRSGEEIEAPPQTMAYEAMEQMEAENYKTAAESFQKLKDRYPYSKYAILAELKMADAMYLRGSYKDALEEYQEFERLHPNNEAVPYVIYQQGMCSFKQMSGYDRDQTPTVNAIQTFLRLQQAFPDSKFASMAMARITEAQNDLAGHEFSVGEFYYKNKKYQAALGRFISLVKNYPDTGYHNRALEYIRICQERLAEK